MRIKTIVASNQSDLHRELTSRDEFKVRRKKVEEDLSFDEVMEQVRRDNYKVHTIVNK